ncbi:hypothetical protein [Sphingomonas xinjiangensis]|uniref:Uncharacterized protein n=1 Tax=Sphingomonas xinjiangensis TaxID=643568 RepID=A0A840YQ06_9SPHN|nr:hypothetical protein [Sphingomonas xinjiangensis]MBB5710651.1 hypothetical protein [Sphingomonas xinjiangensis]
MAMNRFKGVGWFLCGVVVAPACYLVNSHGAAELAKLNATKAAIVAAQKDIRQLETEFNTRANLAQLERWNGEVLALAAPDAQQFLSGEVALANLDQMPGGAEVQTAALIVPTGVASAPAVATPLPAQSQPAQAAPNVAAPAKAVAQAGEDLNKLMKKADRRAVAMTEAGVLSASTLDDLAKLAKREKLALR